MHPKYAGWRRFMTIFACFTFFIAAPASCTSCNQQSSSSGQPCNPFCNSVQGVGQVTSTPTPTPSSGGGPLASTSGGGTQYIVTLLLPPHSSPGTNDMLTLKVTIPQPTPVPKVNDYLHFMAKPDPQNPQSPIFLASSVTPATQQEFENQTIEYQGKEITPVKCRLFDCARQSISFSIGNLTFNFPLRATTDVQGFGTFASIQPNQQIEVIVQFVDGNPPDVKQVTNLTPATPTPTPTLPPPPTVQVLSPTTGASYQFDDALSSFSLKLSSQASAGVISYAWSDTLGLVNDSNANDTLTIKSDKSQTPCDTPVSDKITLTVTDSHGQTAQASVTITIERRGCIY